MSVYRAIIANITWNDREWTYPEIHPQAGHRYAKNKPGHECLNFQFNKPNIDSEDWVYGFFQTHNPPKNYQNGGLIIFYSRDFRSSEGLIVGVYGGAEIMSFQKLSPSYPEFENGKLTSNIRGKPHLSMPFPVRLSAQRYLGTKKRVGQVGYSYIEDKYAETILSDEIAKCKAFEIPQSEIGKLTRIYEYFIGKVSSERPSVEDLEYEQREKEFAASRNLKGKDSFQLEEELAQFMNNPSLVANDKSQNTSVDVYERDPKLAALMKAKMSHICQICKSPSFEGKDGNNYTESHHIIPRSKGGADDPRNIIIICPTCHRKFDSGSQRTMADVYKIIKKEEIFSDFLALKNLGVISEDLYNEINENGRHG